MPNPRQKLQLYNPAYDKRSEQRTRCLVLAFIAYKKYHLLVAFFCVATFLTKHFALFICEVRCYIVNPRTYTHNQLTVMAQSPLDKIQALDAIEKEVILCLQSAGP